MTSQQIKAEAFLRLHQPGTSLLLPNAWNIASARLFEEAGFPAVATTSAGIAFANGYPDGQQISRDEMLGIVARMAAAVDVPVTADIEAGYGPTLEDVSKTITGVIEAGAVGVNLEDNTGTFHQLYPQAEQVDRITAAREAADRSGIPFVINARIDTYLFQVGDESTRLDETLRRAAAYYPAGATSIYVPGLLDPAVIAVLVREIPCALNILVGSGAPSVPDLFKLGVRRISVGSSPMLATMGLVRDIARELLEHGTYQHIAQHAYSYAEASKLFAKTGSRT